MMMGTSAAGGGGKGARRGGRARGAGARFTFAVLLAFAASVVSPSSASPAPLVRLNETLDVRLELDPRLSLGLGPGQTVRDGARVSLWAPPETVEGRRGRRAPVARVVWVASARTAPVRLDAAAHAASPDLPATVTAFSLRASVNASGGAEEAGEGAEKAADTAASLCLGLVGMTAEAGSPVALQTCAESDPGQAWIVAQGQGAANDSRALRLAQDPRLCVSHDGRLAAGAVVALFPCTYNWQQRLVFRDPASERDAPRPWQIRVRLMQHLCVVPPPRLRPRATDLAPPGPRTLRLAPCRLPRRWLRRRRWRARRRRQRAERRRRREGRRRMKGKRARKPARRRRGGRRVLGAMPWRWFRDGSFRPARDLSMCATLEAGSGQGPAQDVVLAVCGAGGPAPNQRWSWNRDGVISAQSSPSAAVLDVAGANFTFGAEVHAWPLSPGSSSQLFARAPARARPFVPDRVLIQSAATEDACLVPATTRGDTRAAVLSTCGKYRAPRQAFRFYPDSTVRWSGDLRYCLTAPSATAGMPLAVQACVGPSPGQRWSFDNRTGLLTLARPAGQPDGGAAVAAGVTGGAPLADGTTVSAAPANATDKAQRWALVSPRDSQRTARLAAVALQRLLEQAVRDAAADVHAEAEARRREMVEGEKAAKAVKAAERGQKWDWSKWPDSTRHASTGRRHVTDIVQRSRPGFNVIVTNDVNHEPGDAAAKLAAKLAAGKKAAKELPKAEEAQDNADIAAAKEIAKETVEKAQADADKEGAGV